MVLEARRQLGRQSRERGNTRGRFRGRPAPSSSQKLRQKIASDIRRRWPELANVLNPLAIELVTQRSAEFIQAIESHPDYARYREELGKEDILKIFYTTLKQSDINVKTEKDKGQLKKDIK